MADSHLLSYDLVQAFMRRPYDHEQDTRRPDVERAKPYRVRFGFGDYRDFATFPEALAFYRETHGADEPINLEHYCGAEDGNHSGLTEAERDQL